MTDKDRQGLTDLAMLEKLFEPARAASTLRETLENHLWAISQGHNAEINAVLNLLETGEVSDALVSPVSTYAALVNEDQSEGAGIRKYVIRQLIALDELAVPDTDVEFIAHYNAMLVRIGSWVTAKLTDFQFTPLFR